MHWKTDFRMHKHKIPSITTYVLYKAKEHTEFNTVYFNT